jgi:hypothetical protein
MFNNLGRIQSVELNNETTKHILERGQRFQAYKQYLNSETLAIYLIDKQHENGNEIHEILKSGIVKIYNEKTKKLITVLAIRTGQISKYAFDNLGRQTLTHNETVILKNQAYRNELFDLNNK